MRPARARRRLSSASNGVSPLTRVTPFASSRVAKYPLRRGFSGSWGPMVTSPQEASQSRILAVSSMVSPKSIECGLEILGCVGPIGGRGGGRALAHALAHGNEFAIAIQVRSHSDSAGWKIGLRSARYTVGANPDSSAARTPERMRAAEQKIGVPVSRCFTRAGSSLDWGVCPPASVCSRGRTSPGESPGGGRLAYVRVRRKPCEAG